MADLLNLLIVNAPYYAHPFSISHVDESLEVLLDELVVGCRIEDLDLESHKVVSEGFQDDKHDTPDDRFVDVVNILDPDILETDNILPAPFDP
jgi:hypothetical protein